MRMLKCGIGVALGGSLLMAVACGGSSADDTSNSAGATGLSGSPGVAGDSSDNGGEPATNGGGGSSGTENVGGDSTVEEGGSDSAGAEAGAGPSSGGMSVGGANTGGSAGRGGAGGMSSGGTSGSGGTAGSSGANSCPATAPMNGGTCTTATPFGQNCVYTGTSCDCRGGGGGGALTWRCTGSGAACPATAPMTGGTCMNPATGPALNCPYPSGSTCRCLNNDTWGCTTPPPPPPPACPATAPSGMCTAVQSCNYGATVATRVRCECDAKTWACGTAGAPAPTCTAKPMAALATGDACMGVGQCPRNFGGGMATRTCVCNGTTVTCN